ncbi:MAG: hypothetical protein Q8O79_00905 [Pseudomonadota bacterium]|nr:hypothetical protein [Pseudomonadota bacterium]
MPPSLWPRLVGLLAVIAIPIGLYLLGQHDGRADERLTAEAAQAVSLRRAISQAAEIARQDAEILNTHEARVESIHVVYRTLKQEASRYALGYQQTHHDDDPCGLDADGLRLWTAANAGTFAAPAAAAPYAALLGAGTAQLGRVDGAAGESYRGGAGLSVVPGAASQPVGVGAFSPGAAVRD